MQDFDSYYISTHSHQPNKAETMYNNKLNTQEITILTETNMKKKTKKWNSRYSEAYSEKSINILPKIQQTEIIKPRVPQDQTPQHKSY